MTIVADQYEIVVRICETVSKRPARLTPGSVLRLRNAMMITRLIRVLNVRKRRGPSPCLIPL